MSYRKPKPKEWRVENGAFIGFVLVQREDELNITATARMKRMIEDWIPYTVDLRAINEVKVSCFDYQDETDIRHNGTFVGTINATFEEILPHWLATRHLFDNPPPAEVGGLTPNDINVVLT